MNLTACFRRGKQFPAGCFCFFTWVPGSSKVKHGSAKQGQPRATGRCGAGRAEPPCIWPRPAELAHDSGQGHQQPHNHEPCPQWQGRSKHRLGGQEPGSASGSGWAVTRPDMGTAATEDLPLSGSKDRNLPLKAIPKQRTRRLRA